MQRDPDRRFPALVSMNFGDGTLDFKQLKNRVSLGYLYKGAGLGTSFQRKISLHSQFEAVEILLQDLRFFII
jgi:hypothetical protein